MMFAQDEAAEEDSRFRISRAMIVARWNLYFFSCIKTGRAQRCVRETFFEHFGKIIEILHLVVSVCKSVLCLLEQ